MTVFLLATLLATTSLPQAPPDPRPAAPLDSPGSPGASGSLGGDLFTGFS